MDKFSLILSTIDTKPGELETFLASVRDQNYPALEIIIVDQNSDNRLAEILQIGNYPFPVVHLHSSPGLSHGRNAALQVATGDIFSFPDDDCWYSPACFQKVVAEFSDKRDFDGVSGVVLDARGLPSANKWDPQAGRITRYNVWNRATSISIFLKRRVVDHIGAFDEELGAGAGTPWGSGEETDYILRALQSGYKIWYDPDLHVFHPNIDLSDRAAYAKVKQYAKGMAKVLHKHHYPHWFITYVWGRTLGGVFKALATGRFDRARLNWAILSGRITGYFEAKSC